MLKKLWMDEGGALISAELVLLATILVCGIVVGASTLRTAIVTEMADVAGAIAALNQSYSVGGVSGHHAECSASSFADLQDDCDGEGGGNSQCVDTCTELAGGEGEADL